MMLDELFDTVPAFIYYLHKADASLCPLEAVFGNDLDSLTGTPLLGHFHVSCTFFFTHHNYSIIVVVLCVKLHKSLGNHSIALLN